MDWCVSLCLGLQSLRRVGISASSAWVILLFITCLQARDASPGPGHQERQSACMGIVLVPC